MNGYLLKEFSFVAGEPCFVESRSLENSFAVAFEDDTDTGYFYAMEIDGEDGNPRILDAVHIYEVPALLPEQRPGMLNIIWSLNWQQCALLINRYCHAIIDFQLQAAYCRNAFPPPNEIWTKGSRELTDDMIKRYFK